MRRHLFLLFCTQYVAMKWETWADPSPGNFVCNPHLQDSTQLYTSNCSQKIFSQVNSIIKEAPIILASSPIKLPAFIKHEIRFFFYFFFHQKNDLVDWIFCHPECTFISLQVFPVTYSAFIKLLSYRQC